MIILLSCVLVMVSAVIHYETLWRLNCFLPRLPMLRRRVAVLVAIMGAMFSHLCQISLFALAFYLMSSHAGPDLVSREGKIHFGDFLYFSMETYTSLGFGEIFPIASLRLLVGIESITGLLMISWTASFTFFEMQKYWSDPVEKPKA